MKMRKTNERGITLISLVITIILLLILATVAINLAVDSDGLFRKAGEAANKWNTSVVNEETAIGNLMTMLDDMDKLTLGKVYNENMIGQSITYEANNQSEWIILGEDPKKAGNILITTKEPVAGGFTLNLTAAAWLSYEEDLHTACSVYGGTIQGTEVEARSITMEDINAVTGFEEPELETYTFGTVSDFANKKVNYIYPKTGSTFTDAEGTAWTSWKQPTAENETKFDCSGYIYKDSQYMYFQGGTTKTVTTTEHIDPLKGDIIWGTDNDLGYVVASHSTGMSASGVVFYFSLVGNGCTGASYGVLGIASSTDFIGVLDPAGANTYVMPVRPVVSLPSTLIVEEVDGVYDLVQ